MTFILPCKGSLQQYYMSAGPNSTVGSGAVNLTQYVHCIRVYESICKEYITVQVIIYDNNNIVENMDIVAGCQAGFAFLAPPNGLILAAGGAGGQADYGSIQVLKMVGEQAKDTLKYQIYTIDLIGSTFYADRAVTATNIATTSGTGTSMIQNVWGQYLPDVLNILSPSSGMIASTNEPNTKGGQTPLTAIHNLMKEMVSDVNAQTGSWVLFKNRMGVNLAQLPYLFSGITSGGTSIGPGYSAQGQAEYFVQKETWGMTFNDPDLYHAIIAAEIKARPGSGSGGRGSGVNISGAGKQQQFAYDLATGNIINQGLAQLGLGSLGSFFSSITSGMPGGTVTGGNQITNSLRWPNPTAPFVKTMGERSYSALTKDSPQIVLKVPLQTGLNVTVGQGIQAYLQPPAGGLVDTSLIAGPWLVTDLVHELYTDQREVQATSVFQCMKGPINS